MNNEEIHIGQKIQFILNQSGLTVSQFVRMLGVNRTKIEELKGMELPIKVEFIPIKFPNPNELTLTINEQKNACS